MEGACFAIKSLMSFSSHFSFFVLVDEVTKNENSLHDFLYDVFRLQGKTGKMKMKNNKKKWTNYYIILSYFPTSSPKTKLPKWNETDNDCIFENMNKNTVQAEKPCC